MGGGLVELSGSEHAAEFQLSLFVGCGDRVAPDRGGRVYSRVGSEPTGVADIDGDQPGGGGVCIQKGVSGICGVRFE